MDEQKILDVIIATIGCDVYGYNEIKEGFSADRKYKLITGEGPLLLRISDIKNYPERKKEFEIIGTAGKTGVKCATPIKCKEINEHKVCYSCFQFIKGQNAEIRLPLLSEDTAFVIGKEAGKNLKTLNEIRPTDDLKPWSERKKNKHEKYMKKYIDSGYSFKYDREILEYIDSEISLMHETENVFLHDDFHVGNIIIDDNQYNGIIDFNRMDWGDNAHEFVKLGWFSRYVSKAFANGQMFGYFGYDIPDLFWRRYSLYMAMSVYSTIVWHLKFFPNQMKKMEEYLDIVLKDHDYFKRIKPRWKD